MYFKDLTPYKYGAPYDYHGAADSLLNIGWLDKPRSFPKGEVSDRFVRNLLKLCTMPVRQTRGHHSCPFCENPSLGVEIKRDRVNITLGSAEMQVEGLDGKTYAAPTLVYHYVTAHEYKPPQEFVTAVEAVNLTSQTTADRD